MMKKLITISCTGSGWRNVNDLVPFQDELKILPHDEYVKLRRSIERYGFTAPVFVWKERNQVLDGHQRLLTVKRMIEEGCILDSNKLPVVEIDACDQKEAKKKVLLFVSQYGKVSDQRLFDYIRTNELDFDELKLELDIPGIEFEDFGKDYFSEPNFQPASIDEQGRLDQKGTTVECPQCGFSFAA